MRFTHKYKGYIKEALFYVYMLFTVYAMFVLFSPHWFFFRYEKVEAERLEFQVGEDLYFQSTSEVYIPVYFQWNEIMFCAKPGTGNFKRESAFSSPSHLVRKRPMRKGTPWKYDAGIPDEPKDCYLKVSVRSWFGFLPTIDTQDFETPLFYIR